MGHEIVYCVTCREQVRGQDFENAAALKIEGKSYCSRCALDVLKTLPEGQLHSVLRTAASPSQAPPREHSSTRLTPTVSRGSKPRLRVPSRRMSRAPAVVSGGVGLLALGVIVVMASGGPTAQPDGEHASPATRLEKTPGVPPLPRTPSAENHPATTSPHEASALEGLRRAREELSRPNPRDLSETVRLLEETVAALRGTPHFDAASRELERARNLDRQALAAEWARVDEDLRSHCKKEEFQRALGTLAGLRPRREGLDWSEGIERRVKDVHREAEVLYSRLKAEALEAHGRGRREAIIPIQERVSKWGLEQFSSDLALAVAPRTAKVLIRENFEQGRGRFKGGELVEGDASGSKALAMNKQVRVRDVFTSPITPSVTLHFKVKPLCDVTGMSILLWSNKINDNYWYHVRGLKTGEWTAVEVKLADARVGFMLKGASPEGDTPDWLVFHVKGLAETERVLIDDVEVTE